MGYSERLAAEIKAREGETVTLLQELLRIPTLNPPGAHYRDICDHLATRLRRRGFACQILRAEGAPGDSDAYPRWNLVARREGGPGPTVHFNSHTDVVELGRDWTVPPFEGIVRDGRVYGRGACDMKGGLAASVIAVEAFVDLSPHHTGAVEISATADEETGGYGGVAWLAERGYFAPGRVDHVIIPEPLNKERICLGHRGVWWAEIETFGRIGHGSMPFLGDCAVRHMGAVIAEMEATLFPALANRRTEMPVVPEGARASTLNINSLHGGQAELPPEFTGFPAPVVPDSCRMIIDRRYLYEETLEGVKAEVHALLERVADRRPEFRHAIRDLHDVAPSMTAKDAPVVTAVSSAIEERLGRAPKFVASPGTYDQKHVDRIGKLKNCIAYGPGILDIAHQPDEWIGIADMTDAAAVMGTALSTLLRTGD
ncbi:MAG: acetylornithine deacetylase/succinyl-diaminopimelate desuccinylase family protein [Pseudomonadota bacterium]